MKEDDRYHLNLIAQLILVMGSILGSLYFSEVMKFPPCQLCWYQRICIYPMAFILLTGLFMKSKEIPYYLLPLSVAGLIIAGYHNLIYYKVIQVIVPCNESAPCTQEQLNWLGFVTIPLLSLVSLILLTGLNGYSIYRIKKYGNEK